VKDKDMLVGWDDGKTYLYLKGEEYCISDEPELVERIMSKRPGKTASRMSNKFALCPIYEKNSSTRH
jgi:hypothetical protein